MTKAEKAKRRQAMNKIDEKADCSGHNHGMAQYHSGYTGDAWPMMAMMAGIIAKRKTKS